MTAKYKIHLRFWDENDTLCGIEDHAPQGIPIKLRIPIAHIIYNSASQEWLCSECLHIFNREIIIHELEKDPNDKSDYNNEP